LTNYAEGRSGLMINAVYVWGELVKENYRMEST